MSRYVYKKSLNERVFVGGCYFIFITFVVVSGKN